MQNKAQKPNLELLIFYFLSHQDVLGSLIFSGPGLERFWLFVFVLLWYPGSAFQTASRLSPTLQPPNNWFYHLKQLQKGGSDVRVLLWWLWQRKWEVILLEGEDASLEVVGTTALQTFLAQDFPSSHVVMAQGGNRSPWASSWRYCFCLPELLSVKSHNRGTNIEACWELTVEARFMTIIMIILDTAILTSMLTCSGAG